ncbi:MAG: bifunctional (p)ppGpp synthetase/guanosine-3',5'-bis(diphosphate) 3'-pyrophosphohydrolase [Muribaculaceae bacterium]|nr:bifunctional (p)ppGpp synthetase/guanosine-3',5'-bis(diphosphate) 3'-pyrophosphohydrolase [Muribaculaceae bacterium]
MMQNSNITPEEEDQMIDQAYQNLLNLYLSSNHRKKVEIIDKAYKFAREAHKGIRRRSGEPYILHPIAVATIVIQEIGLGSTSISAALLHDVVEDTDYTVEDIEAQFGSKIARIVDGLTKISGGIFGDKASLQAENFRKLLLTMSEDVRVVLIKMADRLHNMRTLSSMPANKQYKIAGETLYIYAPLAHRLGLYAIKTELEDLSFKYNHPVEHQRIKELIADSEESRNELFARFSAPIRERLDNMGLKYEFNTRVKSCFSIWNKMQTKHIPFEEVYDLYAARIVFECDDESAEKRICWNIYNEITEVYAKHPDRVRDWLTTPKVNKYRALHVTVMGPDGNWVEVQIRSRKMDDIAERGFAAHWKYKIGEGEEEDELSAWLSTITDILKEPEPNAIDFLDTIKLNLFASEIVVFTPKGEAMTLPKGASVLDVAFILHTDLGTHCIAGKVNHKLVPLSYKLSSGDQVEILTSNSCTPKQEWEKFLVTAKGKTRLRSALRHERSLIIKDGEKRFMEFLNENNIELNNEVLSHAITRQRLANKEELYFMIGNGEIALNEELVSKTEQGSRVTWWKRNPFRGKETPKQTTSDARTAIDTKSIYRLTTQGGVSNYQIADCCHPIPGDATVGFLTDDNQVVVHKMDCPTLARLKASYGSRLLETQWEDHSDRFQATIHIEGIDQKGILQSIVNIISTNMSINMKRMDVTADQGVFRCDLDVLISDASVVTNLCREIKKVKGVNNATRMS